MLKLNTVNKNRLHHTIDSIFKIKVINKAKIMNNKDFDTLSQAVNELTNKDGYKEDFITKNNKIIAIYSKKEYMPEELEIDESYRFEGMTNPADESIVFAITASDGTKGTLVMSYSAEHFQNVELIKRIPYSNSIKERN